MRRAMPELTGKHVWTEILDTIVALQTASDILLTSCYLHRQVGKFFRAARQVTTHPCVISLPA